MFHWRIYNTRSEKILVNTLREIYQVFTFQLYTPNNLFGLLICGWRYKYTDQKIEGHRKAKMKVCFFTFGHIIKSLVELCCVGIEIFFRRKLYFAKKNWKSRHFCSSLIIWIFISNKNWTDNNLNFNSFGELGLLLLPNSRLKPRPGVVFRLSQEERPITR